MTSTVSHSSHEVQARIPVIVTTRMLLSWDLWFARIRTGRATVDSRPVERQNRRVLDMTFLLVRALALTVADITNWSSSATAPCPRQISPTDRRSTISAVSMIDPAVRPIANQRATPAIRYSRSTGSKRRFGTIWRARQRHGFGWKRWSKACLYGTLGLFHAYRVAH